MKQRISSSNAKRFFPASTGTLWVLFFYLLNMTACGGLQSVKELEKIKVPPDLTDDFEKTLEKKERLFEGKRVQKRGRKWLSFASAEAKRRTKWYAKTKAFRVGEKTTLALTWFAIKAGEVTLEVWPDVIIEGRSVYHFKGTAKSSSIMDLIHSVDDGIESYVDSETFYPFKSAFHGVETDRLREGRILFDYLNNKIHYWMKRVHTKKGVKEERRIDNFSPGVLDIFSTAFFLRTQKLDVGQTIHAEVYNEGKLITVKADVLRKEVLVTDIGDFNTLVIRPEAFFQGILKTSGDSLIWVTDDERHFILKLDTKIKIGYLKMDVMNIEDPEYNFSSKIKSKKELSQKSP